MVRCWGSGVDLPARCRRRCRRLLARESYAVCNGRRALLLLREATAASVQTLWDVQTWPSNR